MWAEARRRRGDGEGRVKPTKALHMRSGTHLFGPERVILSLAHCASPLFLPIIGAISETADNLLLEEARRQGLGTFRLECRGRLDMGAISALARFIRKEEIRLLHAHDFKANFYALAASRRASVRTVTTLHNWTQAASPVRRYEWLDALQVRFFDRIIAVSPEIAAGARRWRIPARKLRVILNGVDLARFSPRPQVSFNSRVVIGTVGRLVWNKGYQDLLAAAARVCGELPNAHFLLVGDGPRRRDLEAEAQRLGLSSRVTFAGQRDAVEASYGEMDIFVSSSLTEGLPVAVLEAMASRLPVVATRVGAVPEVIEDGRSGLLVNPGEPEALASAIVELVKNKERAAALARAAYVRVAERFSAESMTRQTEAVYQELLDE